jgi:hypothetical protein
MMAQRQILISDVWAIIFGNLEPCFLADVARVNKLFNLASGDAIFFKKLQQYFPNEDLQAIPVPVSERHKGLLTAY